MGVGHDRQRKNAHHYFSDPAPAFLVRLLPVEVYSNSTAEYEAHMPFGTACECPEAWRSNVRGTESSQSTMLSIDRIVAMCQER
jgi:hypothetical protein